MPQTMGGDLIIRGQRFAVVTSRYHEAITEAAARLRRHFTFARKWGPDRGFLGDGRISRVAFRDETLLLGAAAASAPAAPQMTHEQPHH